MPGEVSRSYEGPGDEPTTKYVDVPVAAARDIAHHYAKAIVVVVAWDEPHNKIHVTTFGREARHKQPAAQWGDRFAAAVGVDPKASVDFEDFRHRTKAEWAVEKDALLTALEGLVSAVVKDTKEKGVSGFTGARLTDAREAIKKARA